MAHARNWTQQTMLPPEAVEAVLRLGIVGAGDHVKVQIEARDATSGELLAIWSRPHAPYSQLADAAQVGLTKLLKIVAEISGPF